MDLQFRVCLPLKIHKRYTNLKRKKTEKKTIRKYLFDFMISIKFNTKNTIMQSVLNITLRNNITLLRRPANFLNPGKTNIQLWYMYVCRYVNYPLHTKEYQIIKTC